MEAIRCAVGGATISGRVRFAVVTIRRGEAFSGEPGMCEGRLVPVPTEGGYVSEAGRGMRALRAALREAGSYNRDGHRGFYRVVSVYDAAARVWWPATVAS